MAPANRAAPSSDTVHLLIDEYRGRFPDQKLQVGFFHGGLPNDALLASCPGLPTRVSLNPADLDQREAKRLLEAGCTTIEIEMMTADPHVLRTCARPYTSHQVLRMGKGLKEMGFQVGLHLVPGLPSADVDGAIRDAAFSLSLSLIHI